MSTPTGNMPLTIGANRLAASAAERWRQVGEAAQLPDDHREILLGLLAGRGGTTITAAADALSASKWLVRTYLERLRNEGLARIEGERRASRWHLVPDGTGQ